jgi:hypothetical protein
VESKRLQRGATKGLFNVCREEDNVYIGFIYIYIYTGYI